MTKEVSVGLFNYKNGGRTRSGNYEFSGLQQAFDTAEEAPALILLSEAKGWKADRRKLGRKPKYDKTKAKFRAFVERTNAWLKYFRKLRYRWERKKCMFQACVDLACLTYLFAEGGDLKWVQRNLHTFTVQYRLAIRSLATNPIAT